ncbi:MAG: nucleotidyl transferase AbiEii/AbiGii toxin family protein [Thermoguttaceae bacterium]
MVELFEAAKEIADFFQKHKWNYAFIGGIAVLRWGDVRTTTDVDVTLLTQYISEEHYIESIVTNFVPRIPDAVDFATKNRIILVTAQNGIPLDISLGGLLFEEEMIERSSPHFFTDEYSLRTCSAEDLIVFKAFADREKDWSDIDSIFTRQLGHLDFSYIIRQLTPLCEMKETPEILYKLQKKMKRH